MYQTVKFAVIKKHLQLVKNTIISEQANDLRHFNKHPNGLRLSKFIQQ